MAVPASPLSPNCMEALVVEGSDEALDGVYHIDLLQPLGNGQPHYISKSGCHLCLGEKNGKHAWVLDECFEPWESTGAAFIAVSEEDSRFPVGQQVWQWFNGSRHVDRVLTISPL